MNKTMDDEQRARGMYGLNFISLEDATKALYGRNFKEVELGNLSAFTRSESSLQSHAEEGFLLVTVASLISVKKLCSLVPGKISFSLNEREKYRLLGEMIRPGRFLIKREPRILSAGSQMMRQLGMRVEEHPKLVQLIYVYVVSELLGRKLITEDSLRVVCREEVNGRNGKTPICFQKDSKGYVEITPWPNEIPSFRIMAVKGV